MNLKILKYWLKNVLRNKFLSISSIAVIWLLVFFTNILIMLNSVSDLLIDSVNSKFSIALFLKDEYDIESKTTQDFMSEINEISPDIIVDYRSKEKSIEDFKSKNETFSEILWEENPIPNTIVIWNIDINKYSLVDNVIKNNSKILSEDWDTYSWDMNINYKNQYAEIENITNKISAIRIWLYSMIAIFNISIFLIIYSVIWNFVYYYRDEIHITRLVWWDSRFIYWPFSVQWWVYWFIATIVWFVLFLYFVDVVWYLSSWLSINYESITSINYIKIFLFELLIFVFTWILSWFFSSKKYL